MSVLIPGHELATPTDTTVDYDIRPVYTSCTGRFCSNQDHTEATKAVLTKMGVEYVFSNDSKRGGLTGNLLNITTKTNKHENNTN